MGVRLRVTYHPHHPLLNPQCPGPSHFGGETAGHLSPPSSLAGSLLLKYILGSSLCMPRSCTLLHTPSHSFTLIHTPSHSFTLLHTPATLFIYSRRKSRLIHTSPLPPSLTTFLGDLLQTLPSQCRGRPGPHHSTEHTHPNSAVTTLPSSPSSLPPSLPPSLPLQAAATVRLVPQQPSRAS